MPIDRIGADFGGYPPKKIKENYESSISFFDGKTFDAFDYTINEISAVKSAFERHSLSFYTIKQHFSTSKTYNDQIEYECGDKNNPSGYCFADFAHNSSNPKNPVFYAHYHTPGQDLFVTYKPKENKTISIYCENENNIPLSPTENIKKRKDIQLTQYIESTYDKSKCRFRELITMPISDTIKAVIELNIYKDKSSGLCDLKSAEITGIIIKNGSPYLKITDTYDKNQTIKSKHVEIFPPLPNGGNISRIKCKYIQSEIKPVVIEFNDNNGKTWTEVPQDKSQDDFYALFNCDKESLLRWLKSNLLIINRLYANALQIQNANNFYEY